MSLLDWANLGGTLLTFGCFSFAITSFGGKLGRLSGFQNTSGFEYITHSANSDELFADIVKVYANNPDTPDWAKDKEKLKKRCTTYQKSLRYWNETSKYCLVHNTVRHQLIKDGIKLREPQEEGCTNAILNNYSDGKDSLSYMVGKKKCEQPPTPAATETTTPTVQGREGRTTTSASPGEATTRADSGSGTQNTGSSGSSSSSSSSSDSSHSSAGGSGVSSI